MPLPSSCLFYRISLLFPKMSDVNAFGYTKSYLKELTRPRQSLTRPDQSNREKNGGKTAI